MKSGNLNFLEPSGPLQACNGTALPLPFNYVVSIAQMSWAKNRQNISFNQKTALREVYVMGMK